VRPHGHLRKLQVDQCDYLLSVFVATYQVRRAPLLSHVRSHAHACTHQRTHTRAHTQAQTVAGQIVWIFVTADGQESLPEAGAHRV
jgi:hypothetical protein